MRDLERERAEDALRKVNELADKSESFKACYRSYVDRFGGAVVINGLGQALATELAAASAQENRNAAANDGRERMGAHQTLVDNEERERMAAHRTLADNVFAWLRRPSGVYPNATDVMAAIIAGSQEQYVRAQIETLAWLTWHKKFCHASLPKGNDE